VCLGGTPFVGMSQARRGHFLLQFPKKRERGSSPPDGGGGQSLRKRRSFKKTVKLEKSDFDRRNRKIHRSGQERRAGYIKRGSAPTLSTSLNAGGETERVLHA